jgi:hypothetical protein
MNSSQKEILERVLLMMKYDSSKTLNENVTEIFVINEQRYNSDWDGKYVTAPSSTYANFDLPKYKNSQKSAKNLEVVKIGLGLAEGIMACKTKNKLVFGTITNEKYVETCKQYKNLFTSYFVDSNGQIIIENGLPIDPNTYGGTVGQMFTVWQLVQPTTQYREKYKTQQEISYSTQGADKMVKNMSLKELSDYISYGFSQGNAKFGLNKNMKEAIILFAKKIKSLNTQELIKLSYKYPCLFVKDNLNKENVGKSGKVTKDEILSKGVQAMIIDFELYKRYDLEYTDNPEKFDYQPLKYPNWDNLIQNFGLSFLKDFKASADKVIERFERGVKGKTEEGYPDYGSLYLNIQGALADMGYMKHSQMADKITETFKKAIVQYNEKNGTTYKIPFGCNMTQKEIEQKLKYDETWSYDNPVKNCVSILSSLRLKAYPEIKTSEQISSEQKENEEQAKKFLEERIKKEFINIDIDKKTWGYPDEDVKGQNVRLGPALTLMNENQISKVVGYLLNNCISRYTIDVDQYQIPYCLRYGLIKEEESDDNEKESSLFKAIVKLAGISKEQIRIMETSYPDKPYLWQDFFQGEPGTYEYYKKNYYVYNAVKQHLIQDGNPKPSENDVFDKIKYFTYDCIGSKDILNSIAKGNWFYNGKRVGEYYANEGGYTKYKIPCTNKIWDKYGMAIQLGGMMLVAAATWGLGAGPALAFWVNMLADSALNAVSLKYSIEEQDPSKIKMDIAFLLLPFLFEAGPVKKLFESMGKVTINQEALNSVISKFAALGNNFTPQQVESLVKSMSSDEKFIVNTMMDSTNPQVQKYVSQISDGLKASVKSSASTKAVLKSLKPVAFQLAIFAVPVATYFGKKLGLIKEKWKLATGKEINEKELKILELFYSSLSTEDSLKVDKVLSEKPQLIVNLVQSPQGEELYKGVTGISKMTPEEQLKSINNLKQEHQKTIERLRKMKEQYNQNVQPENQISTSSDSSNYGNTNFDEVMKWLDEDDKVVIDNLQK